jgi:N-acyl-D-aspartate/D-glutamate deacylase
VTARAANSSTSRSSFNSSAGRRPAPSALRLHPPRIQYDLPAGGRRLLQDVDGYRHTFVAGEEVYADREPTGALPGRLVRGAQPAPA